MYCTQIQNAFINVGKVKNHGVEFAVHTKNLVNRFRWTTDFNVTYLKHEVLELNTEGDQIITANHITKIGGEIGEFYGYRKIGIFNSQEDLDKYPGWGNSADGLGAIIYEDVNGDGIISGLDQTSIGSAHPDYILGMANTFNYKNFDLSVLLTSALGYYLWNRADDAYFNMVQRFNVSKAVINRWRSPEDPGDGFLPTSTINRNSRAFSSNWLEKADHLWIKNIALSYTFPAKALPFKDLRIYTSLQNVFLIAPGVLESNPRRKHTWGREWRLKKRWLCTS